MTLNLKGTERNSIVVQDSADQVSEFWLESKLSPYFWGKVLGLVFTLPGLGVDFLPGPISSLR